MNKLWWQEEKHLEVIDNQLCIAEKNVFTLASEYGTPLFVYNIEKVIQNYRKVKDTFSEYSIKGIEPRVYYAMKANGSEGILKALKKENAFVDATTINEVQTAIKVGYDPDKIIFTGINLGVDNYEYLSRSGILINVDSFSQMRRLAEFAPLNISIRWNPGIGIGFHKGLSMAGNEVGCLKLGIYKDRIFEAFIEAKKLGLNPIGIHQHIGSNWFGDQLATFLEAVDLTIKTVEDLYKNYGIHLEFADFGGGLGVRSVEHYPEFPLDDYCSGLWNRINKCNVPLKTVAIEPGRYISGNAGILVTTANMVEKKGGTLFMGIDAGYNLFNHYFFFGIASEFINCSNVLSIEKDLYTIGGYLCESSDIFAENRQMPITKEGNIIAIYPAGAYGASEMASYQLRSRPIELFLNEKC